MSDYDFGLFSCLVVDDSSYLRTLMSASLRAIGVGNVKTVDDGSAGIEFLQLVQSDPMKAGMQNVDIVFSNWQMHPVDGMMLLRWVRRHKESPNRFIPFVMVTGYADKEKVREARAMGATEMLAKPFSVVNLGQRRSVSSKDASPLVMDAPLWAVRWEPNAVKEMAPCRLRHRGLSTSAPRRPVHPSAGSERPIIKIEARFPCRAIRGPKVKESAWRVWSKAVAETSNTAETKTV